MEKLKQLYHQLPNYIKNRYVILTVLLVVWVAFFDSHNWIRQYKLKAEKESLKEEMLFYKSEIQKDSTALFNLNNNPETQEKFAREKYNMKKDNEDVIIIIESDE
ncbi:MAG: septum formation initiator family protein [Flavobacteriales bacterium]|jgi:cell division protein FtsB|tara:strand:+ start:9521 stop:9835 length:315 start_codon:yes stop_codon:yes gene_type:complete